jgi:hypothetical protein
MKKQRNIGASAVQRGRNVKSYPKQAKKSDNSSDYTKKEFINLSSSTVEQFDVRKRLENLMNVTEQKFGNFNNSDDKVSSLLSKEAKDTILQLASEFENLNQGLLDFINKESNYSKREMLIKAYNSINSVPRSGKEFDADLSWRASICREVAEKLVSSSQNYKGEPKASSERDKIDMDSSAILISKFAQDYTMKQMEIWKQQLGETEAARLFSYHSMYASWENIEAILDIAQQGYSQQNTSFLLDINHYKKENLSKLNVYNRKFLRSVAEKILEHFDEKIELAEENGYDKKIVVEGLEEKGEEEEELTPEGIGNFINNALHPSNIGAPINFVNKTLSYIKKTAWFVCAVTIIGISNATPAAHVKTTDLGTRTDSVTKDYAKNLNFKITNNEEGFNGDGNIFKMAERITKNTIHPYYPPAVYNSDDSLMDTIFSWTKILDEVSGGKFSDDNEILFHVENMAKKNDEQNKYIEQVQNFNKFNTDAIRLVASEQSIIDYRRNQRGANRIASSNSHIFFKEGALIQIEQSRNETNGNFTLSKSFKNDNSYTKYINSETIAASLLPATFTGANYLKRLYEYAQLRTSDPLRAPSLGISTDELVTTAASSFLLGVATSFFSSGMRANSEESGLGELPEALEAFATESIPGVMEIEPGVYTYKAFGADITLKERPLVDMDLDDYIKNMTLAKNNVNRLMIKETLHMVSSGYIDTNEDIKNQILLFVLHNSFVGIDMSSENHPFSTITSNINTWEVNEENEELWFSQSTAEIFQRSLSIIQASLGLDNWNMNTVNLVHFIYGAIKSTGKSIGLIEPALESVWKWDFSPLKEGSTGSDYTITLSDAIGSIVLLTRVLFSGFALLSVLTNTLGLVKEPLLLREKSWYSIHNLGVRAYWGSRYAVKSLSRAWTILAVSSCYSLTAALFIGIPVSGMVNTLYSVKYGAAVSGVLAMIASGGFTTLGLKSVVDYLYRRELLTMEVASKISSDPGKTWGIFRMLWNPIVSSIFGIQNIGDTTVVDLEGVIFGISNDGTKNYTDMVSSIDKWLVERGVYNLNYGKGKEYLSILYDPDQTNEGYVILNEETRGKNESYIRTHTMFISMVIIGETGLADKGYIRIDGQFVRRKRTNIKGWLGQIWYKDMKRNDTEFLRDLVKGRPSNLGTIGDNIYYNEQSLDYFKVLSFDTSREEKTVFWKRVGIYLLITEVVGVYGWKNLLPLPALDFMKSHSQGRYTKLSSAFNLEPYSLDLPPLLEGSYYLYPEYYKNPDYNLGQLNSAILQGINDPEKFFKSVSENLYIREFETMKMRYEKKEGSANDKQRLVIKRFIKNFIHDYKMMYVSTDPELLSFGGDQELINLDPRVEKKLKFKEMVELEDLQITRNGQDFRKKVVKYGNYIQQRREIAFTEFLAKRKNEPDWQPYSIDNLFYFDEGLIRFAINELKNVDAPQFFNYVTDEVEKERFLKEKVEKYLEDSIKDKDDFWKFFSKRQLEPFQKDVLYKYYG